MAGVKGKSGGKRPGSGRPFKTEGCVTKVMRVPSYMKGRIETLIRVQAEWLSEDETKKPVGYLDEAEEKKRKDLVQDLEAVVAYEKKRLEKAMLQSKRQEEDKKAAETVLEYSNKGGSSRYRLYC